MFYRLSIVLILTSLVSFSFGQENTLDFQEALKQAKEQKKLILLNFSGSDWCNPCIRMEKEFFNTPDFEEFEKEHLIFLRADFPRLRKNRLSKDQVKRNENLAEKFNQKGFFPFTILLDSEEKILKSWDGLPKIGHKEFIDEIREFVPNKGNTSKKVYQRSTKLMGNRFDISIVSSSKEKADHLIDLAEAEIKRIELLISSWKEESQTSLINRNAGIQPVKVDNELFELVKRSKRISELTQGAFDISFGSIDKRIWKFDSKMTALPSKEDIDKSIELINFRNIELDDEKGTVFLKNKGMRLGFGAIGKGYAAEMAKKRLIENGVEAGVVNASGDMCVWGQHPVEDKWTIGLADPNTKNKVLSSFQLSDRAVVTSGNYEKYIMIDGEKHSHIIDPRTGYPVTGTKSVTIIAPDAELADALATSIFIMGQDVGLDLVNQLDQVDCIIINNSDEIFYSNAIEIN